MAKNELAYLNQFNDSAGVGVDDIGSEDIILPRLSIAQAMSPEIKPSDPDYMKGLKQGDMFCSVLGQNYGTELNVVPVKFHRQRIKFPPRGTSGQIECRSANGVDSGTLATTCAQCVNSRFSGANPPSCTEFKSFVCFLIVPGAEESDYPMVDIGFKVTQIPTAQKFGSLIKLRRLPNGSPAPIFSGQYKLTTVPQNGAKGDFFNYRIANAGWTPEGLTTIVIEAFQDWKDKAVMIEQPSEDNPPNLDDSPL